MEKYIYRVFVSTGETMCLLSLTFGFGDPSVVFKGKVTVSRVFSKLQS